MKCGSCLKDFNGWLALQNHKNKIHGEINEMAQFDNLKAYHSQQGGRRERERNADEKLHEAISRWKHKR